MLDNVTNIYYIGYIRKGNLLKIVKKYGFVLALILTNKTVKILL